MGFAAFGGNPLKAPRSHAGWARFLASFSDFLFGLMPVLSVVLRPAGLARKAQV